MSERKLIIPHYTYAAADDPGWVNVRAHAESIYAIIINPNSGVGDHSDPAYIALIKELQALGILCIGYVSTLYAGRPLTEISGEVKNWKDWYRPDGIFLDEMSSAAAGLAYYRRASGICYATVGAGSIVVMNPGAVPDPQYATIAGVILTVAETDEDTYANRDFPAWLDAINDRTYHIVYGVTDAPWVWAAVAKNNPRYVYLCTTPDPKPQFSINDTIWPPAPITPTPTPTVPIAENTALRILLETANIIGLGPDQTMKDVPARARQVMAELASLASAPSLRTSTNEQVIGEALRRMK